MDIAHFQGCLLSGAYGTCATALQPWHEVTNNMWEKHKTSPGNTMHRLYTFSHTVSETVT